MAARDFFRLLAPGLCALWANHCGPGERLAGGSEIGNPSGVIVDGQGLGKAGVAVVLLSEDFNPVAAPSGLVVRRAVTGVEGGYRFTDVKWGRYILTALDSATGFRALDSVNVDRIQVDAGGSMLLQPGKVVAEIPDTALHSLGGFLYIPGTLISAQVDRVGRAVLESVPAGQIQLRYSPAPSDPAPPQLPQFRTVAVASGVEAKAVPLGTTPSGRAFRVAPGQNIQAAADSLKPGDTLYLGGGIHSFDNLTLSIKGRADAWIALRNAPGELPILRGISASSNLVDFVGAEFVDVQGLEIDSTVDGSDAFKFNSGAISHHVSLRNLHIHHIRGIAVNGQGDHHHIAVQACHIHHLYGDPMHGIRLGDINGTLSPREWSIENNWIHHCGFDGGGGAGITAFLGARGIRIRDNVVHDNAMLGIRVFGMSGVPSPDGLSWVEGNAVWNCGEGVSAYSDVTVRDNVVFACASLIHSYSYPADSVSPAGNPPRTLRIYNNTFYGGDEIFLQDWDSSRACVFANNAVYGAANGLSLNGSGVFQGNVSDFAFPGFSAGAAAADLRDAAGRIFYPATGSALIGRAVPLYASPVDFTGRARDSLPDVGAYEFGGEANAAPPIVEGFKKP